MQTTEQLHENIFIEKLLLPNPLAAIVAYYVTCLAACSKAVKYLSRHALLPNVELPQQIDLGTLSIGFADRTLGTHIPRNTAKAGKTIRSKLETIGIYRANGREHFRGMVTVPLYSSLGEIAGIYGRRIDRHGEGPTEQHIGCGIFNGNALKHCNELILCENVLDAWTFCAAGHANAICAVDCQLQIDDLSHIQRVLLCGKSIDCEPFTNCEVHRISLPLGHTANSYAIERLSCEVDPLGKLIRAASWISGSSIRSLGILSGNSDAPAPLQSCASTAAQSTSTSTSASTNAVEAQATTGKMPRLRTSPVPAVNSVLDVVSTETETTITIENRRWRIRGLDRNKITGVLRVNLMVYNLYLDRFHVDTFDLYHARSRWTFIEQAADEIGAAQAELRSDLGQVLLKLEELQHEQSQTSRHTSSSESVELSESDRQAALELLGHENLLEKILVDFEACGIVGERTGKLVGYLAATSRLLEKPLGLIIQSSSASGKSSLAEAILAFMPQESRFTCSAMTSQSLYYLGQENLKHKILSIAEEEGVRAASYQLKLLQSEGSLSLISTSKEKGSGRTSTERYTVTGPIALMLTTTASDIDPELMNRCLVVSVDESPTQTAAIHAQQRFARTQAGMLQQVKTQNTFKLHQNAQRLLRPLRVYNPYAEQLAFVGSQTRYRRDHQKYLTLIDTIALLHQYQRQVKTMSMGGQEVEYVEVTKSDIALAGRLADWVLGRSVDELPGPTRRLLSELHRWVSSQAQSQHVPLAELSFTRREVREGLNWNATHLRNHLEQLVALEYVAPIGRSLRSGGRSQIQQGRGKLNRYTLLYDGPQHNGLSQLGLVDAHSLKEPQDANESLVAK